MRAAVRPLAVRSARASPTESSKAGLRRSLSGRVGMTPHLRMACPERQTHLAANVAGSLSQTCPMLASITGAGVAVT